MASHGLTAKQLEIFTNLCICNGIDLTDSSEIRREVGQLEIFFHGYPALIGLKFFPNLHTLKVISQEIATLRPLRDAPNLQELWVCEARLENLFGLECCKQLEKLYLYDNRITDIRPVQTLQKLEVLWLNSNRILNVDILKSIRLTQVNLGSNQISHVGRSSLNSSAESVDLSNNPIRHFCSLYPLTLIANLYSISFGDSKEGSSPLVRSTCYLPWLSYHFPELVVVDGYELTNSLEAKLEAQKSKFKCFIELVKLKNLQSVAEKRFREVCSSLRTTITSQYCRMTELLSQANRVSVSSPAVLQFVLGRVAFWEQQYENFRALMSEVKDYLEDVHQLKAEVHHLPLESGSTVELNVISNSESPTWLSVEKFLSNSFCPELMHRNIRGVMLRNLCQIRETLRKENSNDPSSLNFYYLQHSRLSKRAEDHLDLLQQCLVLNAKVKLTKNLQLVTAEPLKNKSNRLSFFCNAIVVVYADQDSVKTKEVPQVVEETDVELFTEKPEIQEDVELIYPKEEETEEEKTDETEAEDNENFIRSKCRSELHYSQHMTDSCHEVSFSQLDKVMLITFELFLDKRSTELSSFLIVNCLNSENSISDNCETLVTRLWQDQILQDADVEATVLPELLSLPKYSDVSDLLSSCDFAQMSEVYLCGCELKSLEGLETLMNLKKLVACHNQLKNLTELPECLTDLNISFNYLTGIPVNLKPCSHLNSLDFSCNCVTDLAGFFDSLVKFAPKLQELEARWNDTLIYDLTPLLKSYLPDLPFLTKFNGEAIESETSMEWRKVLICGKHRTWTKDTPYPLLSHRTSVDLIRIFEEPYGDLDISWSLKISTLDLSNCNLVVSDGFSELVNVKFVKLDHNYLKNLHFMSDWQQLLEVSANHNRIDDTSGLENLQQLQSVSLCDNLLSNLTFCREQRLLLRLAVAGNSIENLSGLENSKRLEILDVSNNLIATAKDLKSLQDLPSLQYLSLQGNPVCHDTSCRHSVLYQCQKLAVFDEDLITQEELKRAAQLIGFTVSLQFLTNKLGPVNFGTLTTLQFPNGELHSVTLEPKNPLVSVTEVDLSNNKLSDLGGVIYLRSLLRLNLDNNEISCLSNTIKTTPDLPDDLYCRDILQIRLNGNRIRHLKRMCLEIFPKLEHLELRSNNISKLCGVQKLFKLESLDISENRIRSIDSRETENLLKLKVLKAEKNKLKNLDFMTGLEELREVDMSTNCIQSCLNLRALEGLPNVQYFNCHGNPVATKNLYRHFVLSHLKFLLEFDHQPVERTDHEKAASIMKNYRESTTRVLKTALLGTVEPPTSTDNSRFSDATVSKTNSAVRSRLISRQQTANRRLITLPPIATPSMDLMSRNLLLRLNTERIAIDNDIFASSIRVTPAQIHLGLRHGNRQRQLLTKKSTGNNPAEE